MLYFALRCLVAIANVRKAGRDIHLVIRTAKQPTVKQSTVEPPPPFQWVNKLFICFPASINIDHKYRSIAPDCICLLICALLSDVSISVYASVSASAFYGGPSLFLWPARIPYSFRMDWFIHKIEPCVVWPVLRGFYHAAVDIWHIA